MPAPSDAAVPLLARALADEVATLFASWQRTTLSMLLGALIFSVVMADTAPAAGLALWIAAILANQAWRAALARAYHRARPPPSAARRWGARWALGSFVAGGLWGAAAVCFYPASPAHQALLIVCLFGVALGGLNLTAVYKPSFYGFVLPALLPLILRVASGGDDVHRSIAAVMSVVLLFLLAFGHQVNALLTRSLMIRHENTDLIAELKAQTDAAQGARTAAENANRAKSQFLAAASHDLRQPLHALGLFAAALALRLRDADLRPLVGSINASVEALERLFAQLLDLSRLEAGALQAVVTPLPLAPLLERLAADFGPQAEASRLRLRIRATPLWVASDPVLLERMLRNLVSNALRYTHAGGVLVGARRRGGAVRIDVVDTGVGIAPGDRERVFGDFVQVSAAPRHHAGGRGMGLGLAIVRRLADLLDHRLELASATGRGSRFSILLPVVAPAPAAAASAAPARVAVSEPRSAPPFANCCIVAIDDDPAVLAAMRALFETRGGRVITAVDAERAQQALDPSALAGIDLIVADLRLAEGRSGVDEIARLRAAAGHAIPALIVSGDTGDPAPGEVRAAGLTLLPKPLVPAALEVAAIAAIGRRQAASCEVRRAAPSFAAGTLRPGSPAGSGIPAPPPSARA
ncbi:MAG: hybrid sensor histidine kinase/response regulator [Betaproteobacteria bacterium]|nr:hybrid sensor histidine kinase/response regulator [Betaproteobacteria bacterium]